ncbi:hypothetical protein AAE478_008284 [Parahypoxylon ruwenzoriense]
MTDGFITTELVMAKYHIYHIPVRNYHWIHQNTIVESPILDLNSPISTLIVRPLEGTNNEEPRILGSVSDLRDDINDEERRAEAHGVFVPTDPHQTGRFPIWVPVQSYKCKENEVSIVNLTTLELSCAPITRICWVPDFQAPDCNLYTVIGAPRETLRVTRVMVLVQQLGHPGGAKLVLHDPADLANYDKISDAQKKAFFEVQFRAIQTGSGSPSSILLNGYRVYCSPYRNEQCRRSLEEIMDEDLEVPCCLSSNRSSMGVFDDSSDDDSLFDEPMYAPLAELPTSPYKCDCKYADLGPTRFNPLPSHRHGTDNECALGSAHTKHCIFADHSPSDCVISGSGELHEHCVHPSQDLLVEFKILFGQSCVADADAIFELMGSETRASALMDAELAPVDSPSMDSRQESYVQSLFPYYRSEVMDLPEAALQDPAWDSHADLDTYPSPEPQDLLF